MKLDEFLAANTAIPVSEDSIQAVESTSAVAIDCAILGALAECIQIEYQGTVYFVDKVDIEEVEESGMGVVTASGRGTPVRLMLKGTTELSVVNRISAASLVSQRPFVLARPTRASNITFPQVVDQREAEWLKSRGLLSGVTTDTRTMSTLWSDSTSPSTSQPRLDNWISDDSQSDGQHPDD